jgi:hypothetical protein
MRVIKKYGRFAMRTIIRRLTLVVAALVVMAVPVLSDEGIADYRFWGAYEPDQQVLSAEALADWKYEGMFEPDQPTLSSEFLADWKYEGMYEPDQQGVKGECILVASNCKNQGE